MNRLLLIGLLCACLGGGILCYAETYKEDLNMKVNKSELGAIEGKLAPGFKLKDTAGNIVEVIFKDKPTVINFWATWCPPCREEMPELELFAKKYSIDINYYAINIQDAPGKVNDFLIKNSYTMPVLFDETGDIAKLYRINAIPTTLVIDQNGIVKFRKSGQVTINELTNIINKNK